MMQKINIGGTGLSTFIRSPLSSLLIALISLLLPLSLFAGPCHGPCLVEHLLLPFCCWASMRISHVRSIWSSPWSSPSLSCAKWSGYVIDNERLC